MKKLMSLLLALFMALGSMGSTVAFATDLEENSQNSEVDELVSELKFYFEDVGYLDKDGNYYITNNLLLEERANTGDENAKVLLELYFERQNRSAGDFAVCIAKDYLGVYIDLLNGNGWNAFVGYVNGELWEEAAKIILSILGKSVSKANVVATAGQLAWAAYNCRGEW
ncbi:MAG: hypothetical protein MRZ08_00350 [Anaerococcus sp.]|uniref:hypothetical protein n=1 Tax=Anaerococcus sp. TaxID=1872515 RepID=UPI0025BCC8D5|nr:hypothetical protein [Anaerococcus sp.]MCI5971463.1 hypothetical protein [Anaerococcus sp.]MDD6918580.1 hypothetical protein [Peptoniphilaceae bacterium]MDY2928134.1 hypothetical protein [Anaerococcus sp.]